MHRSLRTADESTIRVLDGLVLFWLVFWVVLGAWSAVTIWQVSGIGDTITTSGRALDSAGTALTKVGKVPVVGDSAGALGADVSTAAADISVRGQDVKGQLRQLALMLGIAIMAMPTTPVLGFYLPLRVARRREISGLRIALAEHPDSAGLDRHLAERALANLSFTEISAITDDPWRDLDDGALRPLADAELRRLGVRRQQA